MRGGIRNSPLLADLNNPLNEDDNIYWEAQREATLPTNVEDRRTRHRA